MNISRLLALIGVLLIPLQVFAADVVIENDLQNNLLQSKVILERAKGKQELFQPVDEEISALQGSLEDLKASHLLLLYRFTARQKKAKSISPIAAERHLRMSEKYGNELDKYIRLVESLDEGKNLEQTIKQLVSHLDRILHKKKRPLFGTLPYKKLNYPATEPVYTPSIKPAYKGGNKTATQEDLKDTPEAPLSAEIANFAQSLNWNPVSIYEWVKSNIETEWYRGCMKGAEETLRQGSGNDCDQAALLVALLRASGFPSRYVTGVVELEADKLKDLTGLNDETNVAIFLQKAGIPFRPVIRAGKIDVFEMEHVWIESLIPYSNYRGAIIDEHGKTWLGLDTSIKVTGYESNEPADIFEQSTIGDQLSAIRDEYLSAVQTQTPLEYLQTILNSELSASNSGLTYDDLLQTRTLLPEVLNILPASMQYEQKVITGEYAEIPDELIHSTRFYAEDMDGNELFDITLKTLSLSNRRLTLSYEPETVEDQQIINSYGGLDNTPAYLVRLRPVLMVNGERIIVGQNGLPMGADYNLTIELRSPTATEIIRNIHIAGNLSVIGIAAQKALNGQLSAIGEEDTAETILGKEAMNYIERWNQAEDELASLMHLVIARPVPSVVDIGGVIDVSYLLDTPIGFEWKGVYVDAAHKSVQTVPADSTVQTGERQKAFMQISALQGSVLEHRIFEDDFQVESISTAKLFQLCASNPELCTLITIDKINIDTTLPALAVDDNIKEDIRNVVNQDLVIRIPQSGTAYQDWSGTGYLKENPETGEAGYMLSGMIAGGMTAVKKQDWIVQDLANALSLPFSQEVNTDPNSVVKIARLNRTADYQSGIVGTKMKTAYQVIALDSANRPVQGVNITFKVISGGGQIQGEDMNGNVTAALADQVSVITGADGVARARLTAGKYVSASPYLRQDTDAAGNTYWEQTGFNLVSMSAQAEGGTISTDKPFEAYGKPAEAVSIEKIPSPSAGGPGLYSGYIWVKILDKYGNSISNKKVYYEIMPQIFSGTPPDATSQIQNAKLFKKLEDCPGVATINCSNLLPNDANPDNPIEFTSSYNGTIAYLVLGNTDETTYTIKVRAKQDYLDQNGERVDTTADITNIIPAPPAEFTYTLGNGDQTYLKLFHLQRPSDTGQLVDAGASGTEFPIETQMFKFTESGGVYNVSPVTDGTVSFTICTNNTYMNCSPSTAQGSFNPQTVAANGVNYYSTILNLGDQLGLLYIRADGSAPGIASTWAPIIVWNVKASITSVPIIVVNSDDYPIADTEIKYTIEPADYNPATVVVFFYENDEYMGMVQGTRDSAILSQGFATFDPLKSYTVELVINRGSGVEIKSDKVPLALLAYSAQEFAVDRTYHLNQFDPIAAWTSENAFTDGYRSFEFSIGQTSEVSLKVFDSDRNEKGEIIAPTSLAPGDYYFIVDYQTIKDFGFSPLSSPKFYLLLESASDDGSWSAVKVYPGKIAERTDGKMLGQTLVHDVLIQDGSLNLSRQDAAFKGRGPQFEFVRSYNNQSSGMGHKPLGEGWGHSLDMKLRGLSTAENGNGSVPQWVNNLKGRFYTASDIPQNPGGWTVVAVNGTIFKKQSGIWYAERGRHGTLQQSGNAFIYTSKDGTRYTYDSPLLEDEPVRTIEDRNGNTMTFAYDTLRRLQSVTDASGRTFLFEYTDIPGATGIEGSRLKKVVGPDQFELEFTYNAQGCLESAKRDARVETYQYAQEANIINSDYNLIETTDTNGGSYRYEYHNAGEINPALANFIKVLKSQDVVKQVTYPDDNAALFQYDVAAENRRIVTDLRGHDTTYTLNFYGNPMRIEEPIGKVSQMTWSIDEGKNDNVMTSKTDGRGNTTSYEYDAKGNITKETDPYTNMITTVWNQEFSLPESLTDRNNVNQTWQYDANGNLMTHINGDGKSTTYTYYATGERKTATDPRNNTTTYTYDQWGNPDTVTGAEGSVTDYDHDIRGRRIAATDPNGNKTEYTYDSLDYPDKIIHPSITAYSLAAGSTNVQDFDYDPEGNLLKETDRLGLTTLYTYTSRKQVETMTRNIGGQKDFVYDENGNLLSETDWMGNTTTHTYDDLNRRITTVNRLGYAMSMTYDLSDNLTETIDYEGRITTYEYDSLNRLTDTWQPALAGQTAGNIHNTYYNEADPDTNLHTATDQEGNLTTYEYNGRYLRTKRTNALNNIFAWDYDDSGNLIKETDEELNYIQYEYDKQNRRTAQVQMGGLRTSYDYDPAGNVVLVTDARGKETATDYDEWNRPYRVTDADNYATTTEYDGGGNEVKVTDGNGNSRTRQRDKRGLVLKATDAEGRSTSYAYDFNGNAESIVDPRSMVTEIAYDAEDREMTRAEGAGTPEVRTAGVLVRDKMGNPLQSRDYNGNITTTEYNALNLPKKVCDPAPFSLQCTETTYYKTGKVKTVKNRRGYTTSYEYDDLNREIKVTDAKSQTINTTYDKVGNVKTVNDKRNIVTENFYDSLYRLVRTERAGLRLVTNEYDNVGNLTAVIDANNNRVEHTYNNRNLLDTTTHPDTTTEIHAYDGVGNVLTHTNEESKVTTYTYDKENRRTSVEFAGELTQNRYDENGNLIEVIKPAGNSRAMEYDLFNRLVTVTDDPQTDGLNLITSYEYDPNGNMTHQVDARGNDVEFVYDSLNRKKQHIQHKATGNLVTQYSYDEEGNLTGMTDPKGQVFSYVYDELNRQTDANYPDVASPFNKIVSIHTAYDANNNVTAITETKTAPDSSTVTDTTVNNYDNFDRLDDSTQRGLTVDYGYDNNGNRTLVSTPAGSTTYTFDNRNRLKTAVVGTDVTVYNYYPDGKKDTVTYPNGTDIKYTYYPTNRVETITNKVTATANVISSYVYQYDQNGNRTRQAEVQNGTTGITTYVYDSLDRLKTFTVTEGLNTTLTEYTFEGYNRKTETVTDLTQNLELRTKNYFYDETDWLTTVQSTEYSVQSVITYTYDNNGNMIRKADSLLPNGDTTFTYDSRNKLVEAKRGPPGSETILGRYDYNSAGLRVRHRYSERGDVDYYYDDDAVIEEHNAGDNSLLAHYRYGDRLLTLNSELGTQYYHHDALGSTVNLTTDSGSTQVSYQLDPWGHIRLQIGTSLNRHIFTGQETDENTGLIYFGARYYDPDNARFITQDSYLGESGTPPSLNRYLYAYSNPTVYVDLMGYAAEVAQKGNNEELPWYSRAIKKVADWLLTEEVADKLFDIEKKTTIEDDSGERDHLATVENDDLSRIANGGLNIQGVKEWRKETEPGAREAFEKVKTGAEFITGVDIKDIQEARENPNLKTIGKVSGLLLIGKIEKVGALFKGERVEKALERVGKLWNKLIGKKVEKAVEEGVEIGSKIDKTIAETAKAAGSESHNRNIYESYKNQLRRSMSKPHTVDPSLSNLMDDLYRPGAKIGSGSTADAVRHQLATGELVGGRDHIKKAHEYSTALSDWLKQNPTARPRDRAAAENVLQDLQNALEGK